MAGEVLGRAVRNGAAALHRARGHGGQWRPTEEAPGGPCGCFEEAFVVVQAAAATLTEDTLIRIALEEGWPLPVVPGAGASGEAHPARQAAARQAAERHERRAAERQAAARRAPRRPPSQR